MGFLDNLKIRGKTQPVVEPAFTTEESFGQKHETDVDVGTDSNSSRLSLDERNEKEIQAHPDQVTEDAQVGLKKTEAAALVWSKKAVYATYAWIWVCFFMLAFQSAVGNQVIANAYADFAAAPEISTASILANIIGGVIKLPIAKVLNIWGRSEGFVFFVGVYLLGIIVIASCTGPSGYAAGYVLYWIGYDAIYYILQVYVADTSGLRNRAWAFAFVSTPFICTAFTGPLAASSFLTTSSWRWAWGAFAIIMPFVFLPLAFVFKFYQRKAERMGLYKKESSGRSIVQSTIHYIHEFGIVGMFLLMAAFVIFLLPFSLNTAGKAPYEGATFIAMVVIGFLLFFVFAAWERFFARVHYIRWELLRNRTVLGACCLAAISYFSFYSWDLYYYSFVIVVYNLNYRDVGYMTQIYNVGSCFWGVVVGVYVRYTKHFKYLALCFGLPLLMLGAGLMIHFRGADEGIGYIIMCQIFIAFGGGTLVICQDMAVMASADHDGVPMMLALLGLSSSLGGAIGQAVSAAIYGGTFPEALRRALPDSAKADWSTIYLGGYVTQMTYPPGSEVRNAIDYAWGYNQKYSCISSIAILILAIPAIAIWKNHNVDKKQNKGVLI
ncbi:hypothetical protein AAFC00_000012 [Neodothiora populina]|uniref:Siderochrome-iron transporter n=1 Tax=Neodothiora populina TaxID=2781224 RepID=A0ABR3P190_9PEZI